MQGVDAFIPTDIKTEYLNLLLKVGFDRLDFGSFVSPKAIPQLRDTREVLEGLNRDSRTQLLAIIANLRGAQDASLYEQITFLGYPFSVSETFQLRNTNRTIKESIDVVKHIRDVAQENRKYLLIYLSMGFGNPYGDAWSEQVVADFTGLLYEEGITHFALADTLGSSEPDQIKGLYTYLTETFPNVEMGMHLHSTPSSAVSKIEAALSAGCTRFDAALRGYGGCPMAANSLTGNIATEVLLSTLAHHNKATGLDFDAWQHAMDYSHKVFL